MQNMSASRAIFASYVIFVALVTASKLATKCEHPWSGEDCSRIRVKCLYVNETVCTSEGRLYLPRGGFCGYCDVCVKRVGYQERCNVTENESPLVEALCEADLVCSARHNGTCVRAGECVYTSS